MATHHTCDGCGDIIPGKQHQRGFLLTRDYCDACVLLVDDYLAAVDALHTKLAAEWSQGRADLRMTWTGTLKMLPDTNPAPK